MSETVPHVAICIATFRRPEGLRQLLASLDTLSFDGPRPRVTLVVVDNDPEAPASATLGEVAAHSDWPLIYRTEAERGIVSARNRCLTLVPDDADYVAFVDDDETVSPGWLAAMLSTLTGAGAQAVQGPVEPRYESPPPEWVERLEIFRLGPFAQAAPLNFAATNNSMVDARFLRQHGLRFDPAFNHTGGEDEELFGRLRDAGGRIVAASEAVVYDTVPTGRMTPRWVLRRQHRMGNTLGRVARMRRRGRLMRVIKGLGAVAVGGATALAGLAGPQSRRIAGMMEVARGTGMLAAFLNLRFDEYSLKAVKLDRTTGA
ncbi:MAG: glycosyltransferase [Pseudomonadota bacterium]